jgi:hypothetical protein
MLRRPPVVIFTVVVIVCIVLAVLAYRIVIQPQMQTQVASTPTAAPPPPSPVPTRQGALVPMVPSWTLGIEGDPSVSYPGIPWVRLGYPTCGWGNLTGNTLKKTIKDYHNRGIRVLLTVCQGKNNASLYDTKPLNDAAQGGADAVQCGNEEMKQDPSVAFLYIPPENFARFYDLCESAVHAVNPNATVLLGSLDPHVVGPDNQLLLGQVQYLDQMQQAMDNQVHPGSHWNWHTQILGLINSWHDGYPDASVNNLSGLFSFWAQQFGVDLNSGQLGKHLWVVEGTGCFKGCGVNTSDPAQVAIAHILSLITDVQTTMQYGVPFFYFSGEDFYDQGYYWPIGVLTPNGHNKPLRQDLAMGARKLTLSCSNGSTTVESQEQLLAKLYDRCTLPVGYINTLAS